MTSSAASDTSREGPLNPTPGRDFFASLRAELEMRARMLLAGGPRHREGRMSPDDLVQECLGKLLASYDEASLRERPHNQLMALAYRTMKNLVIDEGRKKAAVLADDPSASGVDKAVERSADTSETSPEEALADAGRAQAVRTALDALSPQERCFVTCVIDTDSVPAAQKKCGWPDKSPYYVLKKLFERLRGAVGAWAP
jgi:DNA-directed RNA polymerase specialized sigma24 family protein